MPYAQLITLLLMILHVVSQQPACQPILSNNNITAGTLVVLAGAATHPTPHPAPTANLFNYTFQSAFPVSPNLIIALAQLDSPPVPDAYLRISSHPASTATVASFQIDSQLKSSAWTKVTISFLAETLDGVLSASQLVTASEPGASSIDRLQSGYFSYPPGWAVPPETAVRVWLSGFHLQLNNDEEWYELQLVQPSLNSSGVSWSILTGEFTQLKFVEVNFILLVFQNSLTFREGRSLVGATQDRPYPKVPWQATMELEFRLVGFSAIRGANNLPFSFSIQTMYSQELQLEVDLQNAKSVIDYAIISLAPCRRCQGQPYFLNNRCVPICPQHMLAREHRCVEHCPTDQHSLRGECVCEYGHSRLGQCQKCPKSETWNGNKWVDRNANRMSFSGLVVDDLQYVCSNFLKNRHTERWSWCSYNTPVHQDSNALIQHQQPTVQPQESPAGLSLRRHRRLLAGFVPQLPLSDNLQNTFQAQTPPNLQALQAQAYSQVNDMHQTHVQIASAAAQQTQKAIGIIANGITYPQSSFVVQSPPTLAQQPSAVPTIECATSYFLEKADGPCSPCPAGCLACTLASNCTQCSFGFVQQTNNCKEICGDGRRFVLQCDDGNVLDGDGCSGNCAVENGYTCTGGSPNTKDVCSVAKSKVILLSEVDQKDFGNKVLITVRVNWLPPSITFMDCKLCHNALLLTSSTKCSQKPSFTLSYLVGTFYNYVVVLDTPYPQSPCVWEATLQPHPALQTPYFTGIDISNSLTVRVDKSAPRSLPPNQFPRYTN